MKAKFYTAIEVAALLGLSPRHVAHLTKLLLPSKVRQGRDWLYSASEIKVLRHRNLKPGPQTKGGTT